MKPAPATARHDPAPLLDMRGVRLDSTRQPGRVLLESVDWRVVTGDFWVLGGLQGSGKTDLLTLTAGLIPPAAGRFELLGADLSEQEAALPLPDRLRIGVLFEGGQLQGTLTVAENVALPYRYHHDAGFEDCAAWVGALLEFTGTLPVAAQMPSALGRNWRLRAGLARALVMKPGLLLLDNPVAGLDPRQAEWWRTRLRELAGGHPLLEERPLTVILTASDLRPWRGVARQFAILKDRRLVQGDAAPDSDAAWERLQAQLLESDADPN